MKNRSLGYISPLFYLKALVLGQFLLNTPADASEQAKDHFDNHGVEPMNTTSEYVSHSMIFYDFSQITNPRDYTYVDSSRELSESTIVESAPMSYLWKDVYFLKDQITSLAKKAQIPEWISAKIFSVDDQSLEQCNISCDSEYEGCEVEDGFFLINPKQIDIS